LGLPLSGGPIFCQNGNYMAWWLIQQGEAGLAENNSTDSELRQELGELITTFSGMWITEKRQKYQSYLLRWTHFSTRHGCSRQSRFDLAF
jgi:hypothetical protein